MKESLKSKFLYDDFGEAEVIEKKISFDFNSLIGNLKNIIVFIISMLISGLKLASRGKSIWYGHVCCNKFG